jgi:hypothetical protein
MLGRESNAAEAAELDATALSGRERGLRAL